MIVYFEFWVLYSYYYILATKKDGLVCILILIVNDAFQRVLAILAQSVFLVESILAMGILHQALRGILLAMRQATRMQEFMDCYFP